MIIIHGESRYGKVDHVPGLFYVTTSFFHLWFFPLIPLRSYILVAGTSGQKGVSMGLSVKSVLTGWARALLFIATSAALVFAIINCWDFFLSPRPNVSAPTFLSWIGLTGVLFLVLWLTYRLASPSYARALRLGSRLGIPAKVIGAKFGRVAHEDESTYRLDSYVSDLPSN
jgi:hypothetical protein